MSRGTVRLAAAVLAVIATLTTGRGTAAAAPHPAPPLDTVCAVLSVPGLVVFVLTDSNSLYEPARDVLALLDAPFRCHDQVPRP